MYGLIGSFYAHQGRRDDLICLMLESADTMPGCLSYVVARDPQDADRIWVTEVWESEAGHKASLGIPAVADVIKRAMPLIARFGLHTVTEPAGGHGLT